MQDSAKQISCHQSRMSAFDRLTPLISHVPDSKGQPKTFMSPPSSLSSPIIKKTPIQIPSFDEKGLVCVNEPHADRSFVPIRVNACSQAQCKQRSHEEIASSLQRIKTKIPNPAKPSIATSPASDMNHSASICNLRAVPGCDTVHQETAQLTDPSPFLQQVNPSILIVPTPPLGPLSLNKDYASPENNQPPALSRVRQHDILDQDTSLTFANQALKATDRRSQKHILNIVSCNPSITCQNSSVLQGKLDGIKATNIAKSTPLFKNTHSTISPKTNVKRQQEKVPSERTESEGIKSANVTQSTSQPVFDELAPHLSPSLRKRCLQYLQNASLRKSNKQKVCKLPEPSKILNSKATLQPKVLPYIDAKRKKTGSHKNSFTPRPPSPKEPMQPSSVPTSNDCGFSQSSGLSQHQSEAAQMEPVCALLHSETGSKDCSCQSGRIEGQVKISTLNQFKTCLPQSQTNFKPAPRFAKLKEHLPVHRISNKYGVVDTGQDKSHLTLFELSEKPLQCNTETQNGTVSGSVASGPIDAIHSPVKDLKYSLDLQPDINCKVTTSHRVSPKSTENPLICVTEEEPYVTMYCLGSVYVDMSDIVPPEVKPKPAIPAKPPNVGAASPSSPFPPPVPPTVASTGPPVPPPSAIPVPIGSHGPTHSSSHSMAHSIGHSAAGHGAGHPPAHSGGHSTSHSSSGGSTLLGYIGIDTIIEQMRKKTMKTGFDFNIMVVGHSGLGKSTLLNTLFKSQVSRRSAGWPRDEKIPKTVDIKSVSHVIEEGGVKMKLTVVDTPGFGDQINNDNCWEPISKYINEQFEKFLKEEVNITRKRRIPDTRVHCCIYFISPTGHSLRQLDIEFMKRLSHSVNIIPVIAKADTMTIEERQEFKQRVRKELEMSGVEFYPQKEFDDDIEDKSDNDKIRETMPFAVVGSDKEYQVNGKRVLGRKTAWGIVEVENANHCEFAQLRDFLIRSHLQDLKEVTHNIHYETYRAKRLNENGGLHPISSNGTQESNL